MTYKFESVYEARLSWWKFFWHFAFGWLIFPIFIAIWQRYALKLHITRDRVILETGILNKDTRDVFISDIRTIDVEQNFIQRLLGYGLIRFATAGTDNYELKADGISHPHRVQRKVNALRKASLRKMSNRR